MTDGHPTRVVIIGGGIAGLAAAEAIVRNASASDTSVRNASAGDTSAGDTSVRNTSAGDTAVKDGADRFAVTVLEAKRVTGGRAGSFLDPDSGEPVDYCQHVAMGCCTNLLGLLCRCGLRELFHAYRDLTFLHPNAGPSQFRPVSWLPPPLHLVPAVGGLRFLSRQQRREIHNALWRMMRTDPRALVALRAGDWLRRTAQSEETLRDFWDVILVSALGESTETVSMAAARKVLIDGFASAAGAADVLVPQRPLTEIFGDRLPAAIGQLGVSIRTSTPVRRLVTRGRDLVGVETVGGEMIPAEHVISAVPWHAIGRLLQGSVAESELSEYRVWDSYPASPITGIHLWFDREITDRPHAVLVGTAAQWLFRDAARGGRAAQEHYYQVVISGSRSAREMGRQALVEQVLEELQRAFPGAVGARLVRSRVVTDPQAVFSVRPEVEASRPPARTPLPWLHLAGDWIATGWPATMEGAVISGRLAAASVSMQEGLSPISIDPGLSPGWLAKRLIVLSPQTH